MSINDSDYLGDVVDLTERSMGDVAFGDVKGKAIPFIAVRNARIITPPLGGTQVVPMQEMEQILAETKRRTPGVPFTKSMTVTTSGQPIEIFESADKILNDVIPGAGLTYNRFLYPWIQLSFGSPTLTSIPSNYLSIDASFHCEELASELKMDSLQIAVEDVTKPVIITVIPYIVIQSQADAVLGVISGNKTPKFTISNLPKDSSLTLTIPASKHPNFRDVLAGAL